MKFALLASGSKGNACLIKANDQTIMIDCGTTQRYLKDNFQRLQFDPSSLLGLLITHTHSDHVKAINLFSNIPTYAHQDSHLGVYHHVEPLCPFELGNFHILPIPTSHDSEGALGYVIESENEKLVYITDTGYFKDELFDYIRNADYYIFESNHDVELLMQTNRPWHVKQRIISDYGHLCNEDSARVLANVIGDQTKEIVLAHLSEEGNTPHHALKMLHETFQKYQIDTSKIRIRAADQFGVMRGGK